MTPTVKLVGLAPTQWARAVYLAELFLHTYPNKMGQRDGTLFPNGIDKDDLYVWRTETQIVVRGTRELREQNPI